MGLSLGAAARTWQRRKEQDDPDVLDRLERLILRHDPHSSDEAATMLDVIAVNVSTGQRCDGLDVRAVETVAAWLRSRSEQPIPFHEPAGP